MRKLMIKLVALETAMVGWLSYWLFLVYANNPTVTQGLAAQLSRFPQLSFTTIDITVLVIIGVLSIFLAFKFQRGLKPGIRLERALQMLENLMKRNLILEAQVAEMKLEKAQITTLPAQVNPEIRSGSWENVFRTPIEAGPTSPTASVQSNSINASISGGKNTVHESQVIRGSSQRAESRTLTPKGQTSSIGDVLRKPADQTASIDSSPEKVTIMSSASPGTSGRDELGKPSREPSSFQIQSLPIKTGFSSSDSIAPRQPYIPVPAPKAVPSSAIVGPGSLLLPQSKPLVGPAPAARFTASPTDGQRSARQTAKPQQKTPDPLAITAPSADTEVTRQSPIENTGIDVTVKAALKDGSDKPGKNTKSSSARKRFPWEDT